MNILTGYSKDDDIQLVSRDSFGKYSNPVTNFEWYFYVDISFVTYIKNMGGGIENFKSTFSIKKIVIESPYAKIYTSFSIAHSKGGILNFIKNYGFKSYEGDVSPYKRMLVDSDDVQISGDYKVLFIDIETDDRANAEGKKDIVVGEKQIISISGFENPESSFTICEENEINVLRVALTNFKKYDVLIGWNSKFFDIPYIQSRLQLYKEKGVDIIKQVGFDWKEVVCIDLMWRFKHVYQYDSQLSSFSLKKVSTHFGVSTKTDLSGRGTWELFTTDRPKLIEYNLQDCRILWELEQKLGIFGHMVSMSQFCKTSLDSFYISELLDNLILKYGRHERIHLPTKEFVEANDESYAGGYVLDVTPGMHNNVHIFDFISLYPNIIITWNISPDTLYKRPVENGMISLKSNVFFDKSKRGILPIVAQNLLDERKIIKNKKAALVEEGKKDSVDFKNYDRDEKIVKELGNSLYGTCGNVRSRYYSIDLAESITLAGQHLIKYARTFFEGLGFVVVAGDTDSIMVSLPDGSDHIYLMNKFHEAMDIHLKSDYNIDKVTTRFKYEKKFSRFICIKKKNYVGRMIDDGGTPIDKLYAKGLELIKKDTITYTRELLKLLLQHLLYEDHDLSFYDTFIKKYWDEMHTREFKKEEICITRKISKPFEEYRSTPVHVKLAKKLWSRGNSEFFIGMDLQFIIVDDTDKENKAIWIEDFQNKFDRAFYWEKYVWPPMRRILEVIYPKHEWDKFDKSKVPNPNKKKRKTRAKKVTATVVTECYDSSLNADNEAGDPSLHGDS